MVCESTRLQVFRMTIRGYLYSKLSFGEVYRRIYGRKFSFTATLNFEYG